MGEERALFSSPVAGLRYPNVFRHNVERRFAKATRRSDIGENKGHSQPDTKGDRLGVMRIPKALRLNDQFKKMLDDRAYHAPVKRPVWAPTRIGRYRWRAEISWSARHHGPTSSSLRAGRAVDGARAGVRR